MWWEFKVETPPSVETVVVYGATEEEAVEAFLDEYKPKPVRVKKRPL